MNTPSRPERRYSSFSVTYDDFGYPGKGVGVELMPTKLTFMTTRLPRSKRLRILARVDATTTFTLDTQIVATKPLADRGADWVSVSCSIFGHATLSADRTPPLRRTALRHTQQVNVASLLREAGRLDQHVRVHAPLMRCAFVRTFEEDGKTIDRYDFTTRVQRHGHAVDQRTLVDVGRDGTIRLAPRIVNRNS